MRLTFGENELLPEEVETELKDWKNDVDLSVYSRVKILYDSLKKDRSPSVELQSVSKANLARQTISPLVLCDRHALYDQERQSGGETCLPPSRTSVKPWNTTGV